MDKNLVLSTSFDSSNNLPLTFGPEWLNKEHSFPHSESSYDEGGRHISPKGRPPPLGKNRLPLKFTRSKSSPLLLQPPKPPEEILKEKAALASSESNQPVNFEKNFPTLSTKAPPTKPATGSAWKQSPIEVITNPKPKDAAKQNGHANDDKSDDLEHLKGLVPSAAPPPPKVLRNNHVSKKPVPKQSSPAGPKAIVKPPFNKSMFRKASSEPALPLNPTYQEKYAKLLAQGSKNSSASSSGSNTPERKDPGSDNEKSNKVFDSRTDFFLGLLKEEQRKMMKQQMDLNEKDQSSEVKSPERFMLNMEDEERFLRDLGWVPEEEAHVPELTEQEILEVRGKILPQKERPTVTFNLKKNFTALAIDPEYS